MKLFKYLLFAGMMATTQAQTQEFFSEAIKSKHLYQNHKETNTEDLARTFTSKPFSLDDVVNGSKMDNKLKHLITQTDNVLDVGFLDGAIKGSWVQNYHFNNKHFWTGKGGYGKIITGVQVASALEYALNNSDDFWEFARFFLAQSAISSVMEHIGYWVYVDSGIPIERSEGLFGWRGVKYPHSKDNNDVGWMTNTPAGWMSQIAFPNDERGTVRKEAVFMSLPILYAFSYLMTPDKEVRQNRLTRFEYVVYMDGVDYNKVTGLNYGTKLGLKYSLPFAEDFSLSFYSSPDLNARGRIAFDNNIGHYGLTIGADDNGKIGFCGVNVAFNNEDFYLVFSYNREEKQYMVGVGMR